MHQAPDREAKNELYAQFARIPKALANPARLEIVDVLAQGERTVEALAREIAQSVANTSQHLQTLKAARLVEVRREGPYAHYRLASDQVHEVWRALRALGEARLDEIERLASDYLADPDGLDAIGATELRILLERDAVTLLDVRPEAEYRAGHIVGAVSIPAAELEARLEELPTGAQVVAYCRGPYCVFADEAVEVLRRRGFDAVRLRDGYPEWRSAGLPTE